MRTASAAVAQKGDQSYYSASHPRNSIPTPRSYLLQGHSAFVGPVLLTPDAKWALTGSKDNTARLWDLRDTNKIYSYLLQNTSYVNSVSLTSDSKWALTASEYNYGMALLWDLGDASNICSYTLQGHSKVVTSVSLTPDGKWAVTGSRDKTACLWDLRNRTNIRSYVLRHTNYVDSVSLTPDGKWAVTGSADTARLWDLRDMTIPAAVKF